MKATTPKPPIAVRVLVDGVLVTELALPGPLVAFPEPDDLATILAGPVLHPEDEPLPVPVAPKRERWGRRQGSAGWSKRRRG